MKKLKALNPMVQQKGKKRNGPSMKHKGWFSQRWSINPEGIKKKAPSDGQMPLEEDFAPEAHLTEQELKNLL